MSDEKTLDTPSVEPKAVAQEPAVSNGTTTTYLEKEPQEPPRLQDEELVYPTGLPMVLILTSVMLAVFLVALVSSYT